jgi:hypothetical protein
VALKKKGVMNIAEVAHLVERQPSKLRVAGSSPVFRSFLKVCVFGVTFKSTHFFKADVAQW